MNVFSLNVNLGITYMNRRQTAIEIKKFVLLQFQNYSYRDLKFVCRVADEPTKDQ